jgi:hypothetical protein
MAGQISPGKSKIVKNPEVTFNIEIHPATPEQKAAGKRLFRRLIERAQIIDKQSETAEGRARVEAEAPPAAHEQIDE